MKLLFVAFILSSVSSTVLASSLPPTIQFKDDVQLYRLICDRTRQATFAQGLGGTGYCKMIKKEAAELLETKIRKNEPLCDETKTGQAVRSFLGPACNAPATLQTIPVLYRRVQVCDATRDGKELEAYLGPKPCLSTFEAVVTSPTH